MLSDFMLFQDERLRKALETLCLALIKTAAPHRDTLHLRVDMRQADGKMAVLFTSGSPEQRLIYTTLVPDSVADAAYGVVEYFLVQYTNTFTGFELLLSRGENQKWTPTYHLLMEPGSQWQNLPQIALRVCGHGFSLTPNQAAIFRWRCDESASLLVATARPGDISLNVVKKLQIDYSENKFEVRLAEGVAGIEQVLEACEGPFYPGWTIETPAFWVSWPALLDLRSPLASQTRFEFVDDFDSLVFIQGPFKVDEISLDDLAGEGQSEVGRGNSPAGHKWVEFAYQLEQDLWRQRQYLSFASADASFVVTAQCLKDRTTEIFACADTVVDSLKPQQI